MSEHDSEYLDKRHAGTGIFFANNHKPGNLLDHSIEVGDQVELKRDNVTIVVIVEAKGEDDSLVGKIVGFETISDNKYKNMRSEDSIHFHSVHIFSR